MCCQLRLLTSDTEGFTLSGLLCWIDAMRREMGLISYWEGRGEKGEEWWKGCEKVYDTNTFSPVKLCSPDTAGKLWVSFVSKVDSLEKSAIVATNKHRRYIEHNKQSLLYSPFRLHFHPRSFPQSLIHDFGSKLLSITLSSFSFCAFPVICLPPLPLTWSSNNIIPLGIDKCCSCDKKPREGKMQSVPHLLPLSERLIHCWIRTSAPLMCSAARWYLWSTEHAASRRQIAMFFPLSPQ